MIQGRRRPADAFQSLLVSVVQSLQSLPAAARSRWQGLLSYLHALVFYERDRGEHDACHDEIEKSVRSQRQRQEVQVMRMTIADMFREEGRLEGQLLMGRKTLLRLIQSRFGKPKKAVVTAVEGCKDLDRLNAWLDAILTADTLDDLDILPAK